MGFSPQYFTKLVIDPSAIYQKIASFHINSYEISLRNIQQILESARKSCIYNIVNLVNKNPLCTPG